VTQGARSKIEGAAAGQRPVPNQRHDAPDHCARRERPRDGEGRRHVLGDARIWRLGAAPKLTKRDVGILVNGYIGVAGGYLGTSRTERTPSATASSATSTTTLAPGRPRASHLYDGRGNIYDINEANSPQSYDAF
jgi:hypothetical protein